MTDRFRTFLLQLSLILATSFFLAPVCQATELFETSAEQAVRDTKETFQKFVESKAWQGKIVSSKLQMPVKAAVWTVVNDIDEIVRDKLYVAFDACSQITLFPLVDTSEFFKIKDYRERRLKWEDFYDSRKLVELGRVVEPRYIIVAKIRFDPSGPYEARVTLITKIMSLESGEGLWSHEYQGETKISAGVADWAVAAEILALLPVLLFFLAIPALRSFRAGKYEKKARLLMQDDSGKGAREPKPESRPYFLESRALLLEAEKLGGPRPRVASMLQTANEALHAIETYADAEVLLMEKKLSAAKTEFKKIVLTHPEARMRLEMIEDAMTRCGGLKRFAEEALSQGDSCEARRYLEELRAIVSNDDRMERLSERIALADASGRSVESGKAQETAKVYETGIVAPEISLRSHGSAVLPEDAARFFKVGKSADGPGEKTRMFWKPETFVANRYQDDTDAPVIIDAATGLMWQRSGSDRPLTFHEARQYIENLNTAPAPFAGCTGWRLPTVNELLSIAEPQKQAGGLYVHSGFDPRQKWCWSCDRQGDGSAWYVFFQNLGIDWTDKKNKNHVRAVRSAASGV